MRKKQTRRMLINAFRTAGADKIISGYLLWFFIAALPIWIWEPYINSYGDSLWFCFASATTIGYGDYHAVTIVGRIITVILSVYSVAVIAIFTAVVTSFFTDLARSRKASLWTSLSIFPSCQRRSLRTCQGALRSLTGKERKNKTKAADTSTAFGVVNLIQSKTAPQTFCPERCTESAQALPWG